METARTRTKLTALLMAACLSLVGLMGSLPTEAWAQDGQGTADLAAGTLDACAHEFVYADDSITVDDGTPLTGKSEGDSYEVSKKLKLTIKESGTYRISGTHSGDQGIVVSGTDADGAPVEATLILDGLSLATTDTAPIVCKAGSSVTIVVEGDVVLTDGESAESNGNDPEGAAVKVKSNGNLVITGTGTLTANGSYKNAIKGGQNASIAIGSSADDTVKVNAVAENNGVASDGLLAVNGGELTVEAKGDGVKASPDEGDEVSAGAITVNGGTLKVNAGDEGIVAAGTINVNGGNLAIVSGSDGIRAQGNIAIDGGSFDIDAQGDGIQTASDLSISDGSFDIKTLDGSSSGSAFDSTTMSCKGLKASTGSSDTSSADEAANSLSISGGTFVLDTADDAIHSDAYATITGGTLNIKTGDDGVHADTTLVLGSEGGLERDPEITITQSYEGLEAGTVYAYSGKYWVVASDDGVNAAGGSSNGSDPGQGGNRFNPGGGRPGATGPGGTGAGNAGDYNLYVYGGSFYVDCTGDGLDSNGGLYLYGGDLTVLSMQANGDNSPLDADGTVEIAGATVFAAGAAGMDGTIEAKSFGQQKYVQIGGSSGGFGRPGQSSGVSYSAGQIVGLYANGALVRNEKLVRNASYILYTSPALTAVPSISAVNSLDACKGNPWAHDWDEGVSAEGVTTYTCRSCGATERKTGAFAPASSNDVADSKPAGSSSGASSVSEGAAVSSSTSAVKAIAAGITLNTKTKVATINKSTVKKVDVAKAAKAGATKVVLGNKVKTVAARAFLNQKKITQVTIGKNVRKIGAQAFKGASKLKKLVVKSAKLKTKSSVKNCLKGSSVKTVKFTGLSAKQKKADKNAFKKWGGRASAALS